MKLFSVIFWIPKYWNSSQANFSIISKYRNSSKANFDIIPKYWNSSQANFVFSEIGNALSNHLLSAPTHIRYKYLYMYSTIHYTLNEHCMNTLNCIASHSAQRVANRFRNNMSMTLFQAFPRSLRYITVNAVHRWQAQSLTYGVLLRNLFATRCALWAAMHILYCT